MSLTSKSAIAAALIGAATTTVLMLQPDSPPAPYVAPVPVQVYQGFHITGMTRSGVVSRISFTTQSNRWYTLQGASNAAAPSWFELYSQVEGFGGITNLTDRSTSPRRFYRVLERLTPQITPPYPTNTLRATNTGTIL